MSRKQQRLEITERLNKLIYNESADMERQISTLPQMEAWCYHPVTGASAPLWIIVSNLNDHYKWSRDRIADWLDSLHDEGALDLSFTPKGE